MPNNLTPLEDFPKTPHADARPGSRGEWIDPAKPDQVHPGLELLATVMDDFLKIPGTKFRIGLDGLLGLVPIFGDLISFFIAGLFLQEAERLGVSRWTKARMLGNSLIDLALGAVPLVGDLFDFGFKANRKNLQILQEHLRTHSGIIDVTPKSYAISWPRVIGAALAGAAAITVYMLTVPGWFGVPEVDIGLAVGALVDPAGGALATFGRFAWLVGTGAVSVLVYAALLKAFRRQSTATSGMLFGVLLWLAGPMLLIPALLNLFSVDNPGLFMISLGRGLTPALIDLGAHLVHGAVAGGVYKHLTR